MACLVHFCLIRSSVGADTLQVADKLNKAKPSPVIWRHNFNNHLVTHKLAFYIPGDFLPLPGSKEWDPNDWTKTQTLKFLELYTKNGSYIRMERWSDRKSYLHLFNS